MFLFRGSDWMVHLNVISSENKTLPSSSANLNYKSVSYTHLDVYKRQVQEEELLNL